MNNQPLIKLKRLGNQGVSHIILPLLVIMAVAVGGTYMLVSSHADSAMNVNNTSIYYAYTAGSTYKSLKITASAGFDKARCNNQSITAGQSKSLPLRPVKNATGVLLPVPITCVTPSDPSDSYSMLFLPDSDTAQKPVVINKTTNRCMYVHSNNASNAQGITLDVARETNGSCGADTGTDTPAAATTKSGQPSGSLVLYSDSGRYTRAAIGVSTIKGSVQATVPTDQARCTYKGESLLLKDQPRAPGEAVSQYIFVDLPSSGTLTVHCSASTYYVYFLKQDWKILDADKFTRVAPSISTDYCTYLGSLGITQALHQTKSGACPKPSNASAASVHKIATKIEAVYYPTPVVIGKPYTQVFELKSVNGERLGPKECAGDIKIKHLTFVAPGRSYGMPYNPTTGTCRYVQPVPADSANKGLSVPKKDLLQLDFAGNKYLLPSTAQVTIDRVNAP